MSNTPNYHRRAAIGNGVEPDNDDIAVYVVAQLYEKIKKMFRERRRRVNEDFVEVFAYLFKKWEKFDKVKVSDKSLTAWSSGRLCCGTPTLWRGARPRYIVGPPRYIS